MIIFKEFLKSLNLAPDDFLASFELFYDEFIKYNRNVNLSAIEDKHDFFNKHLIDSLTPLEYFKGNCLDIGCGAGFPSVPLCIVNKNISFTAIDSINKKLEFVRLIKNLLKLDNLNIIHSRIEDFKNFNFDTVTARAVSSLNILSEFALPFLNIGGLFVSYKSRDTDEEINNAANAIKILGGKIVQIKDYTLFNTDIKRRIIIIEKVKQTPVMYPRPFNKIKKQPL